MNIRRNPILPIPEITPKEHYLSIRSQTILLKGFPQDEKINMDILEQFIQNNNIKDVCEIRMMRNGDKEFLGKVYVQFKTDEIAKSFMEDTNNLNFKFDDKDIEITKITLDDHRNKSKIKKEKNSRERFYDQIGYTEGDKAAKCGFQPGKLLYFTNTSEEITRELIKLSMEDFGQVKWLEFNKGDKEGVIELEGAGSAFKLEQKLKEIDPNFILKIKAENDEKIICELKLKVVEGQEEINYWRAKLDKKKNKNKNVSKKRMRIDPKNVKPEGKITKFSDNSDDIENSIV